MPKRPRHDWSKPLPLPMVIPEVMALQTLADVQKLMRHLPADRRERSTWRHIASETRTPDRPEARFPGSKCLI